MGMIKNEVDCIVKLCNNGAYISLKAPCDLCALCALYRASRASRACHVISVLSFPETKTRFRSRPRASFGIPSARVPSFKAVDLSAVWSMVQLQYRKIVILTSALLIGSITIGGNLCL